MKNTDVTQLVIPTITKNHKSGFTSIYFMLLLTIVCFYCSLVINSINNYLSYYQDLDKFRKMNNIEVLVMLRVRQEFRDYKEISETIRYDGYIIDIEIDGLKAEIVIASNLLIRERTLIYDPISGTICEYY